MDISSPGLFSQRKRQAALEEQERTGASFWTDEFTISVRRRIWLAFSRAMPPWVDNALYKYSDSARLLILEDEGQFSLSGDTSNPLQDFIKWVIDDCPDADFPSVPEAMLRSLFDKMEYLTGSGAWQQGNFKLFHQTIEKILRESRISFDFDSGLMVPFSSKALHVGSTAPALTLVSGQSQFKAVETAFREALSELSQGNARNSITDAATALQQMLQALGNSGGTIPELLKSARKRGFLLGHDQLLVGSIEQAIQWVGVDRSELGDVHNVSSATLDDAWLAVHITGALIVRLGRNSKRMK